MPRLGTDARHRAIGMIQAGTPQCDVALQFGVHRDTISSLWRRFQTTELTDHGLGVHMWRHIGKTKTSGWRTGAIAYRRLVSLHKPFQGCDLYTPGLCTTVCVNTTFTPVDPACTRLCCHAIVLKVYGGHVPIWGGVWENGKLYCSRMNLELVWIIQMVGLWCTAGCASATKLHAFNRDVRCAASSSYFDRIYMAWTFSVFYSRLISSSVMYVLRIRGLELLKKRGALFQEEFYLPRFFGHSLTNWWNDF